MTRYIATIQHYSIASARTEDVGDTMAAAKRNASAEFGDGFIGHEIVILDTEMPQYPSNIVASRKIGSRKWSVSPAFDEPIDAYWAAPLSVVKAAAAKGTMVRLLDPFGLEYGDAEIARMERE